MGAAPALALGRHSAQIRISPVTAAVASFGGLLDQLGQVELLAELVDQSELRLEVVDVLLFICEDRFEDRALVTSDTLRM